MESRQDKILWEALLGLLQPGQRQEMVEAMREPVLTRIPAEPSSIQASSKKRKILTWSANIWRVLLQHKQKFTSLESPQVWSLSIAWGLLAAPPSGSEEGSWWKVSGVDLWWGCCLSWVSWITPTVSAFPRLGHRKLLSFIFLVPTLIDTMLSFSHPVKENRYKFMASSLLIGDVIKALTPPKERWVLLITLSVQKYSFLLHSCSLT